MARTGRFSAVCCLGAVIQGETTHHEYINHQVAAGITNSSRETEIPITFGVLTCQSLEQALDRAGGKAGNKGCEAALAAIEMVSVLKRIDALVPRHVPSQQIPPDGASNALSKGSES